MEVVTRLPPPSDPAALDRLLEAQKLLCARAVSEEDCQQALTLLEELAAPLEADGFDYFPALLTMASLNATGFEPAIEQNEPKAAQLYLQLLGHRKSSELNAELLEDAATQLCNLIREDKSRFGKSEQSRLEELAGGSCAGVVPFVATWTRFAAHELDRQLREASEDPREKERRLARESAREASRKEELARQEQRAAEALARAEELQLEGNDLCRQGQLPGNAKGGVLLSRALELYGSSVSVLSECLATGLALVPEEANALRRRRGTLQSNAAQVCLSRFDYKEARRLAKAAMEDDPENSKSLFRLARAEIELKEWSSAAKTIDEALAKSRGRTKSEEGDANVLELWKLAEEVSKALPDWKWSSSKPQPKKEAEDFEKRLIGFWQYQGGKYEIKIEQWGALIFSEENVKIDLMRKSKLSWRGEFEQIPGMALILTYEPGCDMITTQFIPPEEVPEEQKWKGPTNFTATRAAAPPQPAPCEEAEEVPAPTPAPAPQVLAPVRQAEPAPSEPSLPDDAPRTVWLSGNDDICGCYELVPDNFQNDRPVYQRAAAELEAPSAPEGDLCLWYRGGNWGVTKSIHTSPLAAPFLARCGDASGRSRHPLDIRRPRWHVRRGRGQEDIDPAVTLSASSPASSLPAAGYVEPDSPASSLPAAGYAEPDSLRGRPLADNCPEATVAAQQLQTSSPWPSWVGDVSVEQSVSEVKAAVVVREGLSIALKNLSLDIGEQVLKVGLPGENTLSVDLPTVVDTETLPVARLSEKTRTLRVRLAIRS